MVNVSVAGLNGRSRKGAWIEILVSIKNSFKSHVAPVRERGLKSLVILSLPFFKLVAPVRERGLKLEQ